MAKIIETSKYSALDIEKTVQTIETLSIRIGERFPSSGLLSVCRELYSAAKQSKRNIAEISKPNLILRLFLILIVAMIIALLVYTVSQMDIRLGSIGIGDLIQITEAAINDIILIGAAIFFLVSLETRIKRSRVLDELHELRTIAHVIDMHQLTKDPTKYQKNIILTKNSPAVDMTIDELIRYFDYCSEMLSLTGKMAAIYAQSFRDPVVLTTVNEIENLSTGLSRKIWQKIMILHKLVENE